MTILNPLKQIVSKQKNGEAVAIYSACSANEYVIQAVIERATKDNSVALIEATANQCDQNGGYTGMKPADFKAYVLEIAKKYGLCEDRLFLGGDHLGPLTWTNLPEKEAMANAEELIRHYVGAGFTKIHIDTSMKLADDDANIRLSDEIIAARGARLAKIAEETYQELLKKNPNAIRPVYIVGSEVPIPGGAQEASDGVQVTKVEDFKTTVKTFQDAFAKEGLLKTWGDVIAVVVQPGVEEADTGPKEYNRSEAKDLMAAIKEYPNLVFEGHSTDYQTKKALKELVEDGVGILKVGPGLSFAMREALFALSYIEKEMYYGTNVKPSNIMQVLEDTMLANPNKWAAYYKGDETQLHIKRLYSFSDRCRYYVPNDAIQQAIRTLIDNLNKKEIPLTLLSQYMPIQYTKVREGLLSRDPESLIKDRIVNTIDEYLYATHQEKL